MPPKHRYSSGSDDNDGPPKSKKRVGKVGEEYRLKRDRNNVAVRRSREKSRQKAKETMERVNRLKQENEDLEMKVKLLSKELNLLKDLFLSHASGNTASLNCAPSALAKTEKCENIMNSSGETDDSVDSVDTGFMDSYSMAGAGTRANAEAVKKDHEYSVPAYQ